MIYFNKKGIINILKKFYIDVRIKIVYNFVERALSECRPNFTK